MRWIDKGLVPLAGWSIDAASLFPADGDGHCFLLVAINPFSKWVEACPVPSLSSWWAAEFLFDIIMWWSKPRYVHMDNGSDFAGSFAHLCKAMSIVHQHITVGNSKGNG